MRATASVQRLAFALTAVVVLGCQVQAASQLRVSATTTLIESAVKEIGGQRVAVKTLIAPSTCPGHCDLKPRDVSDLSHSALLISHGYEKPVEKVINSLGDRRPKVVAINVGGSWLVPDNYARGAELIAKALCRADPRGSDYYRKRLKVLQSDCAKRAVDARLRMNHAGAVGTRVLCSGQLAEFVGWLGFDVVGTYGRVEEFTPKSVRDTARIGRAGKVRLVIDNLQSGAGAGRELARDVGAAHATLSSFPGGHKATGTWQACFSDNLGRLARAVGQPRK